MDVNKKWDVTMTVKAGDQVKGGDIYATTPETDLIVHKCMVSPLISGKVIEVAKDGQYTINDVIMKIEDENGKTNLSLTDVGGEVLIISQFTLYANCRKGNRPSFFDAGEPQRAEELYKDIIKKTKETISVVESGEFGAMMQVSLVNEGPFTIVFDENTFR